MSRISCLLWLVGCLTVARAVGDDQVAAGSTTNSQPHRQLRNMFVINEDNSHFFGTRQPAEMTREGLHAFVDQYAATSVTHLFLNPNAMRASFRSGTRDAIWDPVDGKEPQDLWPQNAKLLEQSGLDPYTVWIQRCREKHISPWLSMRMNDVHSVEEADNFMHSTFWRTRPQCWRVPNGSPSPWVNRAMNYAHAEVREHHMSFVKELLERYDPDGLELDWMRFGYHLTPGREREESEILTQFTRDVRSLTRQWAQQRGHSILLGVRVPAHPDAAAGLGMDAVLWATEGLVDLVVPCPFWTTSDFDIPVELWHERLGSAAERVTIAPGVEYNARPWPSGAAVANDLPALRGFAASAHQRGADSLYLFNWMDSETRPVSQSQYRQLLRDGLSSSAVLGAPRRHCVCFRDTVPPGFPADVHLPAEAIEGGQFRIPIGPRPTSGQVWATVCLAQRDDVAGAILKAALNGHALGEGEEVANLETFGGSPARAVRFLCPLDIVRSGGNQLHVQQIAGTPPQQIVWVEIYVEP